MRQDRRRSRLATAFFVFFLFGAITPELVSAIETRSGTIEILTADDFEHGVATQIVTLVTAGGARFELELPAGRIRGRPDLRLRRDRSRHDARPSPRRGVLRDRRGRGPRSAAGHLRQLDGHHDSHQVQRHRHRAVHRPADPGPDVRRERRRGLLRRKLVRQPHALGHRHELADGDGSDADDLRLQHRVLAGRRPRHRRRIQPVHLPEARLRLPAHPVRLAGPRRWIAGLDQPGGLQPRRRARARPLLRNGAFELARLRHARRRRDVHDLGIRRPLLHHGQLQRPALPGLDEDSARLFPGRDPRDARRAARRRTRSRRSRSPAALCTPSRFRSPIRSGRTGSSTGGRSDSTARCRATRSTAP